MLTVSAHTAELSHRFNNPSFSGHGYISYVSNISDLEDLHNNASSNVLKYKAESDGVSTLRNSQASCIDSGGLRCV